MKVLDKQQIDGFDNSKDQSNIENDFGLDKGNILNTNAPCSGPSPIQPVAAPSYYH